MYISLNVEESSVLGKVKVLFEVMKKKERKKLPIIVLLNPNKKLGPGL